MRPCPPLLDVIGTIPDVRQARGKRHPLAGVLALACAATLCGARSYSAMAEWGRTYGEVDPALLRSLGLREHGSPSAATLHRIFRWLNVAALEAALGHWAQAVLAALPRPVGLGEGVALDGKTLRGTRRDGAPGVHLLSAVSHRLGLTLGQVPVGVKTNEIPLAHTLLAGLLVQGRVLTMDALLTQRAIAQDIVDRKGDYLMVVKDNQPALRADLVLLFETPTPGDRPPPPARRADRGHGRREQRTLQTSTALTGYLDWPGLAQVFRATRRVVNARTGEVWSEIVYGITSLAADRATPSDLLRLLRDHWTIENRLHWVRDVTYDEDRSQARAGVIPEVMAAIRNLAIGLLRLAGFAAIAPATRRLAALPWQALALLGCARE
ncbi:MAG: ISAs1 family transposase [Chloroflexota bacterium]